MAIAERRPSESKSESRPRQRRLTMQQRRRQLLDTAARQLSEGGTDALKLASLAAAAGISKPVVYDHFNGRTALIVALVEDYGEFLTGRVRTAIEAHPASFEEALKAGVHAYFDCVQERGVALKDLLASAGIDRRIEEARQVVRSAHVAMWQERVEQASRLNPRHAKALAAMMIASNEAAVAQLASGTLTREEAEALHVQVALAAVAAAGKGAGRATK